MSVPSGIYEYISPDVKHVFGFENKDFLDNKLFIKTIIHPEFRNYFEEKWNQLLKGRAPKTYEYKIIDPEGKERWILQSNSIIFYKEKLIAIEGICRNITEYKSLEQNLKEKIIQLQESNIKYLEREKEVEKLYNEWIKYKTLVEGLNEAIFRMSLPEGKYEYVSPVFNEVTGYDSKEIVKEPLHIKKSIHPDFINYFKDNFAKLLNGIVPKTFEYKIIDPEGKERWILQSNKGVYDDKGNLVRIEGLCRNITKQKNIEEKLKISEEKYRKAYIRANFYKDLFSHDIKNILHSILSAVDLLKVSKNYSDNNKLEDPLNIIVNEIQKASNLIANLNKIYELEEQEIRFSKVEIMHVLHDSIKNVKMNYPKRRINIHVNSYSKNVYVAANSIINDLFENILTNAVQHNRNSIIEIAINIFELHKEKTDYIKMEFIDNGIGIEDKRKNEIFNRAFQEEVNLRGIGLGLSLVSKIIKIYNGEIWVENKIKEDYRKGCCFVLLLPKIIIG
ncbi:MAG: putative Histidine kinase [Promethearchaeota archaeon]|nr:MAG: putative Histidine kinase [Candidatus Lokiarchaeota archaeon]